MTAGKKIAIISGIVLVAAFAVYWFYYRKADPKDDALVAQMKAAAEKYIDGGFPAWILAKAVVNQANPDIGDYYRINGKLTKAGALLATFDADYWPHTEYSYRDSAARNALHEELHALLNAEKANQY